MMGTLIASVVVAERMTLVIRLANSHRECSAHTMQFVVVVVIVVVAVFYFVCIVLFRTRNDFRISMYEMCERVPTTKPL